jgi:hypothetical protein
MNKQILANQIITDCEELGKDVEAGIYENDLQRGMIEMERIIQKFSAFCHYDEKDYEDLILTDARENPEHYK